MQEPETVLRAAMEAHGDAVYRLALCRTQSVLDAEDVYQDVFLSLLRQKDWAWKDARRAAATSVDARSGATLTVRIGFTDGNQETQAYRLFAGRLRMGVGTDGELTLLPGLAGDTDAYFYGVYATPVDGPQKFFWPAAASCRTVTGWFGEKNARGIPFDHLTIATKGDTARGRRSTPPLTAR